VGFLDTVPANPDHGDCCLQAAVTFATGKALNTEVSSVDVLKIADYFKRWLAQGDSLVPPAGSHQPGSAPSISTHHSTPRTEPGTSRALLPRERRFFHLEAS
jgi:hypothetical protein